MPITSFPQTGIIGQSLLPKRYDIEMYQGDTFEVILKFRNSLNVAIDLTGVTYICKFVGVPPAADPATQPVVTASTPANGEVTITIVNTSSLSGEYQWDLQLVNGTKKRTYIGGVVTVTSDITP